MTGPRCYAWTYNGNGQRRRCPEAGTETRAGLPVCPGHVQPPEPKK